MIGGRLQQDGVFPGESPIRKKRCKRPTDGHAVTYAMSEAVLKGAEIMSHPGKGPEVCPPAEGAPVAGAGAGFAFVVVVFVLLVIIGAVIVRPY